MTTVKEFRDLGVPFVYGDKCTFDCQEFESISRPYSDVFADSPVTHFAWRPLNTIPDNPKFKYERTGSIDSKPMWRPLLDQSEVIKSRDEPMPKLKSLSGRFKHYEDDEIATPKPVFTQAMADAGELPPVGSEVTIKYRYGNTFENVTIKYASKDLLVYNTKELCERYGAMECIEYIKPIYIRTPKQKAVDDLKTDILNFYGYNDGDGYKSLSEYLNEIGYRKID